jgi:hypothetical protein
MNRDRVLQVRLTENEMEQVDQIRGDTTRSGWARDVITTHLTQQSSVTKPTGDGSLENPYEVRVKDVNVINIEVDREEEDTDAPTPSEELADLMKDVEVPPDPKRHFHKRGERMDPPRWEKGRPIYSYYCAEKNCTHILHDE